MHLEVDELQSALDFHGRVFNRARNNSCYGISSYVCCSQPSGIASAKGGSTSVQRHGISDGPSQYPGLVNCSYVPPREISRSDSLLDENRDGSDGEDPTAGNDVFM